MDFQKVHQISIYVQHDEHVQQVIDEQFLVQCWKGMAQGLVSYQGAKYLVFFSSHSLKTREKYISFAQLVMLSLKKLRSKHTFLKKYTNWAELIYFSLVLKEREEKKPKYFAPKL